MKEGLGVQVDRISGALSGRFKIPPPPTIAARLIGNNQISFSHFRNLESRPESSAPPEREEGFVLCASLTATRFSRVCLAGRAQSVLQSPGEAYLFDLTSQYEISLDAQFDNVRFQISQAAIDEMAYEKGIGRVGGLHSKYFGQQDQILHHLAQTILPVIENTSAVTTAFVEYIALAFHDHVIYTYGGVRKGGQAVGGLSPWQLRRACDFIEANLAGDPSIQALSAECGLSTSYFTRAFRLSKGMTPHQWIIQRRISRGKSLLRDPRLTLAEIAQLCGFVDQSHFGRHFVRATGTTPAQARRDGRSRG
ncbi:helix-turn-helix transcriptional regulator [Acidisoma cellulosilytica]|uniref:Helix-turn-helix transcriptional regulator n=1 Tax=Acidisoma cellulosilyticum TaxID=2802395 RepID=A0A964E6G2_9PROT|nr:AraC family transcriptional regulator [Acidisoma cellulosilyticum]MCB8883695.1 helix-turn-helix transcriptional regulator [Acidisoma cellulosilyticum]